MEFRKMRRFNQELSREESIKILEENTSGVLAVSGDNDYPYAVPLSYVYTDGKIIFHCAKEGHKLDAIMRNDKVSFCVIAKDDIVPEEYTTYFKSVIAFGKIKIVDSFEEMKKLLVTLSDKYRPGYIHEHERTAEKEGGRAKVLVLEIEHLSGKQARELIK